MNDETGGRRYQDEVPAVARAVRLLERLAVAREPRSLAALARELAVGPSSLLAILTTLRHAGLVARDDAGRYQLGAGLAALGGAATCRLRACERFAAIADGLIDALGETVLLWVRHEDTFVLAGAREGTQPLRFVPLPAQRLPAHQTRLATLGETRVDEAADHGTVVEEELLPGVWMVAARLRTASGEMACIALAGPRERLGMPSAGRVLLAATGDTGAHASPDRASIQLPPHEAGLPVTSHSWSASSGPFEGAELDAFLSQSLVATLSYLADDGYPATVPLWYAWDGASFWLASRPGSEWAEHVTVDPRVSLAVSESTPPLRRVLARGPLVEVDDPGGARAAEIEAQLAARYAGFDAAREPATAGRGRLLELRPERLIAWRGLLRHPRLPDGPDGQRRSGATWRRFG